MTTYYTQLTTAGAAAVAAAVAGGTSLDLTHMAVGDGGGNPITPDASMTTLVRERYRSNINLLETQSATRILAELVIPVAEGGWSIYEVGLFATDGTLIAVANFPGTYKPTVAEGATRDLRIWMLVEVSTSAVVTLVIDPSVVSATRAYADQYALSAQIPGGTTHQILRKKSNTDGDVEWADLTAGIDIQVGVIEEQQTLTSGQTTITLGTVTTNGLAVYIGGSRIPNIAGTDGWQKDAAPNDLTRIVLGRSYPAGTLAQLVQNEPAGELINPLVSWKNLSDVEDPGIALGNLGGAPIDSPAFLNDPTCPTQAPGTSNTTLANTAFAAAAIAAAINALVDSAPASLNTLDKLAAAIGDNPSFATAVATALAGKQPLDGTLTALAALTVAANKLIYATGADAFATTDLTSIGRALIAASTETAGRQAISAASASVESLEAARVDVASASTVNLTTAAPNTRHINITGSATINGFTVAAGRMYFVRFSGAVTLTNSAALVTQSGANIVTSAGDTCILRATAANTVEVMSYMRSGRYSSAEQTITSGGTISLSHGLGATPYRVWGVFVCKTAEHGFSVGDQVECSRIVTTEPYTYGAQLSASISAITVRYGDEGIAAYNSSGAFVELTNANWRLIVRAEL